MFYLLLLVLAAAGGAVYFYFFMQSVPGAVEDRFGALEPLPPDLGVWKEDVSSPEGLAAKQKGQKREERYFFEEAKDRLLKQVRYRDLASDEILSAEPDQVVRRRRSKA